MESFKNMLDEKRILFLEGISDKNSVLASMSNLFETCDMVHSKNEILPDILARENIISTGIGAGIAIPHIHKDYIEGVNTAFCVLKNGIDFNSMDKSPVHFIIMILTSGKEHERYLKVIAKFANMLRKNDVRKSLMECSNVAEIINILNNEDSK